MNMINAIAHGFGQVRENLRLTRLIAIRAGTDVFQGEACETGDTLKLNDFVAYIRVLTLVQKAVLEVDSVLGFMLRNGTADLDLRLVEIGNAIESLLLSADTLRSNSPCAAIQEVLKKAEQLSPKLDELANHYVAKFLVMNPPATAQGPTPLALPDAAPVQPAVNESDAGEDFDAAVEAAGRATMHPPVPPTPPST